MKLTYTHTHNFFHLAYRSQIWTELNALTLIIRGFRCRCAFWRSRRWSIIFRGPHPIKPKFWGVNRHFKPILQKNQIPISSKLCIGFAQNLTGWCSGRHLEFRFLAIISASINIFAPNLVPIWKISGLMPMTHAPETGTENWYQFSGTSFSYQLTLEAKFMELFLYTTVPPIYFKTIKQQTTQLI